MAELEQQQHRLYQSDLVELNSKNRQEDEFMRKSEIDAGDPYNY